MSNSSLVMVKVPAHEGNYTKGRINKNKQVEISEITIHHMAGVLTAKQCGAIFAKNGRGGSTHYGVGNDGSIGLYVNESDTAWANSNWEANCRAVTIETSNSSTGGNWPVSDKALKTLIKLVADIAKRNGLGKLVKGKNLTWHQMYASTACPGPYLLSKMDYIAEEANKINGYCDVDSSAWDYPYSKDKTRGANMLVLYTKGSSTKTNKWGRECHISKSGIVLDKPVYGKGNMSLGGNRVLSGHGEASAWMEKIKEGYHIYFNNGRCYIDAGTFREIDAENSTRKTNYLVKYTKTFKNNVYGSMVSVDKNGNATCDPVYGLTTMSIPSGGFVLSAHGTSSKWLMENIKKGSKISFVGSAIKVK